MNLNQNEFKKRMYRTRPTPPNLLGDYEARDSFVDTFTHM